MKSDGNFRGIILMLLAMGAFALADTLVKVGTAVMSPAQILLLMLVGGLVLFAMMAVVQRVKLIDRRAFMPIMLLRYFAEIFGMTGLVLALAYVPLSTFGAVTQASPILVAVGAVLVLGEKISWRRWTAIAVGFIGVLIIVQPGTEGFDLSVLWAVLAMVSLSLRDLTTRMIPPDIASVSLAIYTMVATIPFALGWVLVAGDSLIPDQFNWWVVLPMVSLGAVGYLMLIASMRMANVSVVTPFRYSRIIYLLALGMIVFGERPGVLTLFGAVLVIASGIYMMIREQRVRGSTG